MRIIEQEDQEEETQRLQAQLASYQQMVF